MLTTALVIAAIAYLVSRETEQRSAVEFFAAADQSSDLHADASADLESTLGSIGLITRQELTERLAGVVETAVAANALLAVDPPVVAAEAYGTMTTASDAWVSGVTGLEAAVARIVDGDIGAEAVGLLGESLDLLRAGDVAYDLFLTAVEDPIEGAAVVTFDRVTYINPDAQDPTLYDPTTLALKIGVSYELAPRHDVSVIGQFDPEPVGDRVGVPLVPYSDTISLMAVVTNSGNEAESDVEVVLEVFDSTTSTTETYSRTIAALDPSGSASITFADLDLTPGSLYQVTLIATIADDGRPDDNTWIMSVIRNEES